MGKSTLNHHDNHSESSDDSRDLETRQFKNRSVIEYNPKALDVLFLSTEEDTDSKQDEIENKQLDHHHHHTINHQPPHENLINHATIQPFPDPIQETHHHQRELSQKTFALPKVKLDLYSILQQKLKEGP